MEDPFNLQRFIDAQAPIYEIVLSELEAGRKQSHWMWFIFPQLVGLAKSTTAAHFGITSSEEAKEYLKHSVLRARLKQCCEILIKVENKTAAKIFGPVDTVKLSSCLTLFSTVSENEPVFKAALIKYFDDTLDDKTLSLLRNG